jgi:hypothetical protein
MVRIVPIVTSTMRAKKTVAINIKISVKFIS